MGFAISNLVWKWWVPKSNSIEVVVDVSGLSFVVFRMFEVCVGGLRHKGWDLILLIMFMNSCYSWEWCSRGFDLYQCFQTRTDPAGQTGRPANRSVQRFRQAIGPDMQLIRWNLCDPFGSVGGPLNLFNPPDLFFHFF